MFFLIGVRTKAKAIGQLERPCAKCARSIVQTVVETRKWLTLFFIPCIPLGGNNCAVRCNLCGLTVQGSPELKTQLAAPKAMAAKA
jgi:zinc ribbon protein